MKKDEMLIQRIILLPVLLLGCFEAASAEAATVYEFTFADSGGVPTSSFLIGDVGGAVDVQVFLTERDPAVTGPYGPFVLDDGLISANFQVTSSNPVAANVLNLIDVAPNPDFDDLLLSTVNVATGSVDADLAVDLLNFSPAVLPSVIIANSRSTYLGTLRYTALAAGATDIVASLPNIGSNIFTELGDQISAVAPASATITVTGTQATVPEPGSLAVFAGLMSALGTGVWLRGRGVHNSNCKRS